MKKSLDDSLIKNEELTLKLEGALKTSNGGKAQIISKSYQERFGDEKKAGPESKKFNINNSVDRTTLKNKVTELSGINKGGDTDMRLVKVAQEIEITKNLSIESVNLLKSMDIEVLLA